ncbi:MULTISPECIES: Flp family type IVb pilin [Burkholderia]|uniref:Pilus assembly protein Flp/PilA n=1 Tax=Burkholderia pyrrocinia TaxID=60550 RepID=A0A318IKM0_BURPY|nr:MULTISPECIES: Flp family type IVb pilin [Burkholderia]PXX33777.1 pilus assembly protein Flp/PilA [Burkholderia pyrrocinia]SFW63793.1 pilus assembly protein Flp/PilA [Burkholderia sp. NFACC33-1]SFY23615.1 pilus assembly protein Flp/PilA [Burkholderia sp. NFPP32]
MSRIIERIAWFTRDQRGVTAIEYGLIAALIAVGIVAALATVGADLQTVFNTVADDMQSVVAGI